MIDITAKKLINKYHPKIIGILSADGSSGIKEAFSAILKNKFSARISRPIENIDLVYEEIIGTNKSEFYPAFLFKIMPRILFKKDFPQVVVLEIIASNKDNIKKIASLGIDFDFLIIDSIAGNGGRLTDIRNLIKSIGNKTKIIVNKDDKNLAKLNGELKNITTYSMEKNSANVYALALSQGTDKWLMCNGKIGLSFKICLGSTTVPVRMERVVGKEYVASVIASYPVALALGMNLVDISEALQDYRGIPGKMNLTPGIKNTLIIDQTKNASCDYVKEAIVIFKKIEHRRKIAVFGDILNLGKNTEAYHRKIGKALAAAGAEILVAVGERSVFVKDEALKAGMKENDIHIFSDDEISKAGIFVQDLMKEKDVVLVTGSEELHMKKIIKEIMAHPV